jgi:hypothetical protein
MAISSTPPCVSTFKNEKQMGKTAQALQRNGFRHSMGQGIPNTPKLQAFEIPDIRGSEFRDPMGLQGFCEAHIENAQAGEVLLPCDGPNIRHHIGGIDRTAISDGHANLALPPRPAGPRALESSFSFLKSKYNSMSTSSQTMTSGFPAREFRKFDRPLAQRSRSDAGIGENVCIDPDHRSFGILMHHVPQRGCVLPPRTSERGWAAGMSMPPSHPA